MTILPPTLILAGPTGVGKTELAVRLAEGHPYELISADSMQVYRGLEIGTAQPTAAELRGVPLHGCGIVDPQEAFNAKKFLDFSAEVHGRIVEAGRVPLYVGGTGMYLRALRFGLFEQPDSTDEDRPRIQEIRARLMAEAAESGPEALHRRLAESDPAMAARIASRDAVRIVRALEVLEATGRPLSQLHGEWGEPRPRFDHVLIVLSCPRAELVARIERRTDAMLAAGWVEETRRLLAAGVAPAQHCFKALGYAEIIARLRGELSEAEMRDRIKARTRQFAKRQMTWFRKEPGAVWIERGDGGPQAALEKIDNLIAARAGMAYKSAR